jgi:hypothetical protein
MSPGARLRFGPALAGLLAGVAACSTPKAPRRPDDPPPPSTEVAGEPATEPSDAATTLASEPTGDAADQEESSSAPVGEPEEEEEASLEVHGSLSTWLRSRNTSGAHDNDLRQVVSIDVGDPTKDPVSGHFMAQGSLDLDGDSDDVFAGLSDTYDSALTARLYDAFVDFNDFDGLERLRLGRQFDYETPELAWFDGALVETSELTGLRSQLGLYGGIPVHAYESSPEGDALIGAFATARPWEGNRLRLDWMHLQDERGDQEYRDDLFGARAWQNFGPSLLVEAGYTRLEQDDRDVRARTTWHDVDSDLTLEASWYQLLEAQADLALELDPFYNTLLELFPYTQTRFMASKGFGERFDLQAGMDLRRVSDEDDIGDFNRDFERYFLRADLMRTLPAGLDLGAIGEVWVSDGTDVETWGLDLEKELGAQLEASAGTIFALYKFDVASQEERENVRTWFLRLRWKRTKSTTLDAEYDYEDSDGTDFHTLRLGGTWRF